MDTTIAVILLEAIERRVAMTAEIAILNKSAVALAADSTVTIGASDGSTPKTYNTVNKLFTLSKYHPVGVMIFGNAEMMGVPWETIIKQYRSTLEKTELSTIDEYAAGFLSHLESGCPLLSRRQSELALRTRSISSLNEIHRMD